MCRARASLHTACGTGYKGQWRAHKMLMTSCLPWHTYTTVQSVGVGTAAPPAAAHATHVTPLELTTRSHAARCLCQFEQLPADEHAPNLTRACGV
jgi:hypothetical protein